MQRRKLRWFSVFTFYTPWLIPVHSTKFYLRYSHKYCNFFLLLIFGRLASLHSSTDRKRVDNFFSLICNCMQCKQNMHIWIKSIFRQKKIYSQWTETYDASNRLYSGFSLLLHKHRIILCDQECNFWIFEGKNKNFWIPFQNAYPLKFINRFKHGQRFASNPSNNNIHFNAMQIKRNDFNCF